MPDRNNATFCVWDDYFIPDTNVLRNKFTAPGKPYGEPDPDTLQALEEYATRMRMAELKAAPIAGRFDYAHMKAIHRHIFGDVYAWAGHERVAPVGQFMTKPGPDVVNFAPGDPNAPQMPYSYYPAGPQLTTAAEHQYTQLARNNLLRGRDHGQFTTELAEIWGELNVIHSFREGNTRAQFVFFSQLCEQAGWRLDPAQFAPGAPGREAFVNARFYSQATGSNTRLAAVLAQTVTAVDRPNPTGGPSAQQLARDTFPPQAATTGYEHRSGSTDAGRYRQRRRGYRQDHGQEGLER